MWSRFSGMRGKRLEIRNKKGLFTYLPLTSYVLLLTSYIFFLSACGFSPVYKKSSGVTSQMQSITVDVIPNREGQYLRNELIDILNTGDTPSNPRYTLMIDQIREQQVNLDITRTSNATRTQLRLSSTLRLKDNQTGDIVLARPLQVLTSTNILASEFANRVSQTDARFNALDTMADQIRRIVALHFAD